MGAIGILIPKFGLYFGTSLVAAGAGLAGALVVAAIAGHKISEALKD